MEGIFSSFLSFLDFLGMIITFPLWLAQNIPSVIDTVRAAIMSLPEPLGPIAFFAISLIVVMGVVKIL